MQQQLLSLDCQNFVHYKSLVFLPILGTLLVQGFSFERLRKLKVLKFSKFFKNTICIGLCKLKCTKKRFIPFTPLHFLPYFVPHTEFKGRPEYATWNETPDFQLSRALALRSGGVLCVGRACIRRRGANQINLVRGVSEAGQTPHWSIRCRRPTEAAIAADGASSMLDTVQGWDTSVRRTIYKGRSVQGAQHPRIFGRGHIGRGHINPASNFPVSVMYCAIKRPSYANLPDSVFRSLT